MTVLRLVPRAGHRVAPALGVVDVALLARSAGAAYAGVAAAGVRRLTRALALAGIAAEPCDAELLPPRDAHAARGIDLAPLMPEVVELDLLRVERVPLGRATREVLRRRFAGLLGPDAAARARCRALLRGEHVIFAWSRRAWASRTALRSVAARRSLRPIVFDPDDAARHDLTGRTSSDREDIDRWLFG